MDGRLERIAVLNKQLTNLEVKNADKGEVQAVFSTFNQIDHDRDVTRPDAFTAGGAVKISAYGHASHNAVLPVGKGKIRTTPREAILDGQFFLGTAAGRDTFTVVKEMGDLQEWSYGYDPVKFSFGEFAGEKVRFLEQVNVVEVSPVLQGAGVNTRTLSAKCDRCQASVAGEVCPDELAELAAIRDGVTLREAHHQFEKRAIIEEARKHLRKGFVEVLPASVPAATRSAAADSCRMAAERLQVSTPSIRWFEPAPYGKSADFTRQTDIDGMAGPGDKEIWLRADVTASRAAEVGAHELAHVVGWDEDRAALFGIKLALEGANA